MTPYYKKFYRPEICCPKSLNDFKTSYTSLELGWVVQTIVGIKHDQIFYEKDVKRSDILKYTNMFL